MNLDTHRSDGPATTQSGFTIALLFYLVTLGGITSACLRPIVVSSSLSATAIQMALAVGAGTGLVLGSILSATAQRHRFVALIGAGTGTIVGLIAGALALVPSEHFLQISLVAFVGCWILITCVLLGSRYQASSSQSSTSESSTSRLPK